MFTAAQLAARQAVCSISISSTLSRWILHRMGEEYQWFEETEDRLEDVFVLTFRDQKEIVATTWCDGEFSKVTITNGSRVRSPIQCGTYIPLHLFIRAVEVRAEEKRREGDNLVEREANSGGLKIIVERNEAQAEVNTS